MSNIEWTSKTWNPVIGCRRISPGCGTATEGGCYAEVMARRIVAMGGPAAERYRQVVRFDADGKPLPRWNGKVALVPELLAEPLRRRKPTMYFVDSMSVLFHEGVPMDYIAEVFGVMAVAGAREYSDDTGGVFFGPGDPVRRIGSWKVPSKLRGPHTFQILTKRAERMASVTTDPRFREMVASAACRWAKDRRDMGYLADCISARENWSAPGRAGRLWPLPNVWLGVSVESPEYLWRLDHLRQCPAAVRFVSAEPLIADLGTMDLTGIGWVIPGGESGRNPRPCNVEWIRGIVRQCREAGVACFVKQLGARPRFDDGNCANIPLWHGEQMHDRHLRGYGNPNGLRHPKGGDPAEWPEDLRVRQFPEVPRA